MRAHLLGNIQIINKEEISLLQFPKMDVVENMHEKRRRHMDLMRAMILGNSQKRKVKIYFEDDQGEKMVETTIWSAGEDIVTIKGGMHIPVSRISRVSVY